MGRRKWFVAVVCIFLAQLAVAQQFSVAENAIRVSTTEASLHAVLPIVNGSAKATSATLHVQVIDADDEALSESVQAIHLVPGRNLVDLELALPSTLEDDYPFYRLRYELKSDAALVRGTVALGSCMPELFALSVAHPSTVSHGSPMKVRVHAANPVTQRPVAGVAIVATVEVDPGKKQSATAISNLNGEAVLSFGMPHKSDSDDLTLTVDARKGPQKTSDSYTISFADSYEFIVSTDKTLYQPGQNLDARALVTDPQHHVLADTALDFELKAPDGTSIFDDEAITNEFGIASVSWKLPASARLGDYNLNVSIADADDYSTSHGESMVKVSRYELPQFTVAATPDRAYYLPGQDATVDVSAEYLFGKPVTKGSVRLVRETERRWDYKSQKWEKNEEESQSTVLGADGHAKFRVPLEKLHAEFGDNNYRRFEDCRFFAYVTDATTNRTEQRRLDLRLSHDPMHIYVAGARKNHDGRQSFYLSTFLPDGSPVSAEVEISQKVDEQLRELRTVHTNKYGVVHVAGLPFSADADDEREFVFHARAKDGTHADYEERFYSDDSGIEVGTPHVLYKAGDPIEVSLHAPRSNSTLILQIQQGSALLHEQEVRLHHGDAFVVLPYEKSFKGVLSLLAYVPFPDESSRWGTRGAASKVILYPEDKELKAEIHLDRESYRPGETAHARVQVKGGALLEPAALGVSVVDKAVEERARTDEEFGAAQHGFWNWRWLGEPPVLGSVTLRSLQTLEMSQQVPEDLEAAADYILNSRGGGEMPSIETPNYEDTVGSLFKPGMRKQLDKLEKAVREAADKSGSFATNNAELEELISASGLHLAQFADPWETPYRYSYGLESGYRTITVTSLGPDKTARTADDIEVTGIRWNYFTPIGKKIDEALRKEFEEHAPLVRDYLALSRLMHKYGTDLGSLRDPWGQPYVYEFKVIGRQAEVVILTHGVPSKQGTGWDTPLWTSSVDYFVEPRGKIDEAMNSYALTTGRLPKNDAQFEEALKAGGLAMSSYPDPWGHSYFVKYAEHHDFNDHVEITYSPQGQSEALKPVTRTLDWVYIWSAGPDGVPGTPDDIQVADYARVATERSAEDLKERAVRSPELSGSFGAIEGTVKDVAGAVIVGAKAVATLEEGGEEKFTSLSDKEGNYLIRNLKPGFYKLTVSAKGFSAMVVTKVPVHSSSVTAVNVVLPLARVSMTVEVRGTTMDAAVVDSGEKSATLLVNSTTKREQNFTPRVRDYFPETLYWAPSLITDASGKVGFDFKLADSLTTWKINLLASRKNGTVGYAEKEFHVFQPFFAEFDPPKVLTVGDRLDLPVVVRNYLNSAQSVQVQMKPADWFQSNGAAQELSIAAGDSAKAVFPVKITTPVEDAKQKVTAANSKLGDAVAKPVRVHPNGREQFAGEAQIVSGNGGFTFELPANAIPGSIHAQLRVFPSLAAELTHSVEAGLERPYGCGEQTISSTYPSLMLLEAYKSLGVADGKPKARAEQYLNEGFLRLQNYREDSGGYTYWGRGEPDVALTAYAVQFLSEAGQFVDADGASTTASLQWLLKQQHADGSWKAHYGDEVTLTSYVARVLASQLGLPSVKAAGAGLQSSIDKALIYLAAQRREEPLVLAERALILHRLQRETEAKELVVRLRTLAHHEGRTAYWSLESNTAFYGWGRTGRLQTTATVVQALAEIDSRAVQQDELEQAGLEFLMHERDRYGVWYSGQTTLSVLRALSALIVQGAENAGAVIRLNGREVLTVPAGGRPLTPLYSEIDSSVHAGANKIEIVAPNAANYMSLQLSAQFYTEWRKEDSSIETTTTGDSDGLRLAVHYDKSSAAIGEAVRCRIEAERFGHRGYGMLIAEIGLPPAAEIDRSSLEEAMESSGWELSHYDVLPDRVVLYLWPRAGGTKVAFTFRPRIALDALSAPSVLYDYYNPDAQTVVKPTEFVARPE